ncbi:YceD family protein [Nitratidesulfovibrio sp. D1]|uniref:YceD family protein n=1 Tax=Nitratidesulfovibrio sp. D1 TaxID=3440151 RepID=UPI003EBFE213
MHQIWIPLKDIPAGGGEYEVDDQSVWQGPIAEFSLPFNIVEPLRGSVFLLPQDDGCLVRGRLTGRISAPCDRCAEPAELAIDHSFDSFEPFPAPAQPQRPAQPAPEAARGHGKAGASEPEADGEFEDVDEAVIRISPSGQGVEVSLSGLLWEEFLLALPAKPLCSATCQGLCPSCGSNLNTSSCACTQEEGDPRLAALRGLTIGKK